MKRTYRGVVCLIGLMVLPLFSLPGWSFPDENESQAQQAVKDFRQAYANKNEHVRKAAVMGLGDVNHELTIAPLLSAVNDPAPSVRDQVRISLSRQTSEAALTLLFEKLGARRKRSLRVNMAILEAFKISAPMGALDAVLPLATDSAFEIRLLTAEVFGVLPETDERLESTLLELSMASEPQVRLAAIDSLGRKQATGLLDRCLHLLSADPDWRVRAACIEAVRGFRKKETIQPLIDALRREKGRLRDDCQEALVDLTADAVAAKTAADWQKWWDRIKDRFVMLTAKQLSEKQKKQRAALFQYATKPREGYGGFAGIPTRSQRILFLLDVSASMSDKLSLETNDASRLAAFKKRYGDYATKIELAREEMINTVASLPGHVSFNIVTFHSKVESWKKGLVPANQKNKNMAIRFLSRLSPLGISKIATASSNSGRTNTFDALNVAFGLAKKPTTRPSKNHRVDADTIFLLTDGMPTTGRIRDPGELLRYFSVINKRAKMVFHCITFGHGNVGLLEPIASRSGGKYLVIEL